jgi:hypothetical protein
VNVANGHQRMLLEGRQHRGDRLDRLGLGAGGRGVCCAQQDQQYDAGGWNVSQT